MDAVRLPSWKCWRETWRAGTAASRERLGTGHRGGCSGVSGCIGMRAPAEIEKVTFDMRLTGWLRFFKEKHIRRHREYEETGKCGQRIGSTALPKMGLRKHLGTLL